MSTYTTGEIAKLCGVTVRTVQYYDTRKILVPDQLSEGGRRLYSEDSLKQMKADPKEMTDFSVESIGDIAITMRNKKSLKKVHQTMLALGIPMNNGTTLWVNHFWCGVNT